MTDITKSKVINTALEVLERSKKDKHDELIKEIEKIKAAPCINEIDRIDTFCDKLFEDDNFMRALLVVSMSDHWVHKTMDADFDYQGLINKLPDTFVFDDVWAIVSDMKGKSKCDREFVLYLLSVLSREHISVHIIDYEKTYYKKRI